MSERLSSSYQPLFQVHILHHYWLDDGNALFDNLPEDAAERAALKLPRLTPTREQHLRGYDVRQFLTITPTPTTAKSLLGFGCIFKNTALGFMVIASKLSVLPKDLQFEFVLKVKNPDFFNYTALTLRPQPISEFYVEAEDKTCRYKKNVPVLSNLTGDSRTDDSNKSLYLSKPFSVFSDSADYPVEALVQIGDALVQLTSDQPDAGQQEINADINKMPVFVHQGDVPAEGILLGDIPDDVFALIRLATVRADDEEFSLITAEGTAKMPAPVFQIRFKNRSMQWQYYHGKTGKNTQSFDDEDKPEPLPLTFFGNASSPKKQKPSQGIVIPEIDDSVPPKVLGLRSEIFE